MTSKLQVHQLEQIEHYLLAEGIESLDFYHEVLDHIILKVESDMNQGRAFEASFIEIKHEFLKQKPYSLKNYLLYGAYGKSYKGVKALEIDRMRRMESQIEKKTWFGLGVPLTGEYLIILTVFLGLYFSVGVVFGITYAFWTASLICIFLGIYILILTTRTQVFRDRFSRLHHKLYKTENGLERRKKGQLIKYFNLFLLIRKKGVGFLFLTVLLLFFSIQSMSGSQELGENMQTLQFLMTSVWLFFFLNTAWLVKMEYDKTKIQER